MVRESGTGGGCLGGQLPGIVVGFHNVRVDSDELHVPRCARFNRGDDNGDVNIVVQHVHADVWFVNVERVFERFHDRVNVAGFFERAVDLFLVLISQINQLLQGGDPSCHVLISFENVRVCGVFPYERYLTE